jgi:uncharacterized protein YdhG (YjbR/CyaY superfamily)
MAKTVDEVVAGYTDEQRAAYEQVRAIVVDELPGCTTRISYGMPTFDVDGRRVVHVGVFTAHVGMYPVHLVKDPTINTRLDPYRGGKGTVRFPFDEPLPEDLVRAIVRDLAAGAAD